MKSQSRHILIYSVFESNKSPEENLKFHLIEQANLRAAKIPHIPIEGLYNGIKELGFIVDADQQVMVEHSCRFHRQECYLEHHPDRHCELVYVNGKRESLGTMVEVGEERAKKRLAYTKTPDGRYFIVE